MSIRPSPLMNPLMKNPMSKKFEAFRRLTTLGFVFALLLSFAVDASAQRKGQPPQPGNGWINTPSGNKTPLRGEVAVGVRHESPVLALGRVVAGAACVKPVGRGSELSTESEARLSVEFHVRDTRPAILALPIDATSTVVLLHGFGTPIIVDTGANEIEFDASKFVDFARKTSISTIRLQIITRRGSSVVSMPVELVVDVTRDTMRIEF